MSLPGSSHEAKTQAYVVSISATSCACIISLPVKRVYPRPGGPKSPEVDSETRDSGCPRARRRGSVLWPPPVTARGTVAATDNPAATALSTHPTLLSRCSDSPDFCGAVMLWCARLQGPPHGSSAATGNPVSL